MSKDSTKQILRELKKLRKELGGRLDHLESRIDDISGPSTGTSQRFDSPPISQGLKSNGATSRQSFTGPTERDVTVKIQPLTDLGMARVVESALADTEGVENASLRELRGDSAIIDARVSDGVPLISSLRRKLPIAFDVTDSDRGSFTIALTQPEPQRSGGVATQDIQ